LRHGSDHEELFDGFGAEGAGDKGTTEGGDDISERSNDDACGCGFVAGGEEVAGDFESAEQAEAAMFGVGHRKAAEAFTVNELDGVVDGGIGADGENLGLHDVTHFWADISEKGRSFDVKETEDEIDSFVGVSSSSGHDLGHS
jgi:hypothetical protein